MRWGCCVDDKLAYIDREGWTCPYAERIEQTQIMYHTASGSIVLSEDDILLTREDLAARWGFSYAVVLSLEKRGYRMPTSFDLPTGVRRWRLSDVKDFEEQNQDAELFVRHRNRSPILDRQKGGAAKAWAGSQLRSRKSHD